MGLIFDYSFGQTPLEEDEKEGLKIKTVTTLRELNEFVQQNIEQAVKWSLENRFVPEKILTEAFVKNLHRKMFSDVWKWAGKFRTTKKNLGVDKLEIGLELRKLLDDTKFWIEQNSFDGEEIAIRFKHRIVSIHCFSNGNGRHSRLMADIIIKDIFHLPSFTWGRDLLAKPADVRDQYLKAIKAADNNDFSLLMAFAVS